MSFTTKIALTIATVFAALSLPTSTSAAEQRTYFVGDSIGFITHEAGFLDDFDVVDSVPGRKMSQGRQVIESLPLAAGDTLVIELGTNDLSEPASWVEIERIVAAVPTDVCIVWVTPSMFYTPDAAVWFNGVLVPALAARSCVTLVPWATVGNATMTYDTVHPTYYGAFVLAALIDVALTGTNVVLG